VRHRHHADLKSGSESGPDGVGDQLRVAVHRLVDDYSPHGYHSPPSLAFVFILLAWVNRGLAPASRIEPQAAAARTVGRELCALA
jgi:hypothetical protein